VSRLKELRIHGFKSFAEPTRFVFEPGVTAIIGPNGSGKSNMADAIRWVLGEQSNRSLRTRRADDVIFVGSETRKPIGMAEVTLTFDNRDGWLPIDYEEVTITRRAYRSGDPEYLINGSRARLRDVVELLAAGRLGANELVVVGQGTVDAALSLRPDERRQLFEEAAGVKSLQVRRNESTSRLGRARDNLTRVSDLVRELRPQVRRLALQAEHQEAHDRLGRRARDLVLEHHARRSQALQTRLGEARRRSAALGADLEAERGAQATGRQVVEAAEARYWAAEGESRSAAASWEAAREAVIRAEGKHESLVERDLDLAAEATRSERELAELAELTDATQAPAAGAADDDHRAEAAMGEQRWRDAADRARAADAELFAAEEALASARGREADLLAERGRWAEQDGAARARREHLEAELGALAEALAVASADATRFSGERNAALAALGDAEERATAVEAERASAADEATRVGVAVAELEEKVSTVEAELSALPGSGDEADHDLGSRLRARGWPILPESLRRARAEVETAIGAVLGDTELAFMWQAGADGVVSDATGEAHLLRPGDGTPSGRSDAMDAVQATRTLAEFIGGGEMPEVLHRTVVAPDLESLLNGWARLPDGWAAVTLAGDLADARGMATVRGRAGGVRPAPSLRARRAQLAVRAGELQAELAAARGRQQAAAAAVERLSAVQDAAVAALGAARVSRRRAEEDGDAAEAAVGRTAARQEVIRAALAEVIEPPAPTSPTDELAASFSRLEGAARLAREGRDAVAAERDEAREAWNRAVLASDARDSSSADQRAAAARYGERRDQLTQQVHRFGVERTTLAVALSDATAVLATARAAEVDAGEARLRAEEARETERQALLEAERRLSGGAGRLSELEGALQQIVAEVSRLDEALAAVDRERELALEVLPEVAEAEGAPVDEDAETPAASLADDELAEELRQTRRTLHQIGSVNPFAIEEHRELSARLNELSTQEADLRAAAESTESLIARLDQEIAEQFQAAFGAIGQRFDEYCRLLFAGGSASLELSEDADSEAPGGIEIAVRPPGKRLQRLAMLSGGERALAGVALLFAMLSVNPVPFCVLDEVDAALDEANIGRFADALRRLAESIDFVVITHNRATIETADTIYGVTMTDAAVSRVLSLRLADLPVEVAV
jgi:chromosome segregation protein